MPDQMLQTSRVCWASTLPLSTQRDRARSSEARQERWARSGAGTVREPEEMWLRNLFESPRGSLLSPRADMPLRSILEWRVPARRSSCISRLPSTVVRLVRRQRCFTSVVSSGCSPSKICLQHTRLHSNVFRSIFSTLPVSTFGPVSWSGSVRPHKRLRPATLCRALRVTT